MARKKVEKYEIKAFLGYGSEFKGTLIFEEKVRIDGIFEGQITSKDALIIGETGIVKGDLDVAVVIVHGTLEGNIINAEKIEIHGKAKVSGEITTKSLEVHPGSCVDGTIKMTEKGNGNNDQNGAK